MTRPRPKTLHVSTVSRRPSARRRRIVFWVLLAFLALGGIFFLLHHAYLALRRSASHDDLFILRRIDVATTGILSTADILREADIQTNMNIWAIDPAAVRARLEGNPLIASATVSRQLPDGLHIDVVERTPAARLVTTGGGTALAISHDGHVMGPSSVRTSLPVISGLLDSALTPGAVVSDPRLPDLMAIIDLCHEPSLREEIVPLVLDVADRTRIRLVLQSGEEILLSLTGYEDKLRQFPLMRAVARDRALSLHTYDLTVDKNVPATP